MYLTNKQLSDLIFSHRKASWHLIRATNLVKRSPRSKKAKNNLATRIEAKRIADDQLIRAFLLLARHIVTGFRFKDVEVDDAIQELAMTCFTKVKLFKPKFGVPFNYFTSLCLNAMRQIYRQNQSYIRLTTRVKDMAEAGCWDKADRKK